MKALISFLSKFSVAMVMAMPAVAQQLSYTNYLPPTHATKRYALEPLFETVKKETNGSLTFQLHAGGSMVGGKGTISAIRDSLVDGGFVVSLYHQNEIPLNTVISDMAFFAKDPLVAMGAVNETVLLDCKECLDEYRKYKIVYMGAYATTPYMLMCKKPAQGLADIKGLKMRAAGTVYGRWATRMGGVPVNIPNSEAYEALERGQLDCLIGSMSWLKTLSLWDMTKNVVDLPMGAFLGGAFISFNEDSWNSVKKEDRDVFVKHLPAAMARLAVGYAQDDMDVAKEAKSKGVQILEPKPELTQLLDAYRQDEVKNTIEAAKSRGAKNPEKVVEALLKNLEKWQTIVDKIGHDEAKYEQALRDEIYSKVTF